jgi:hypothetical protein
MTEIEIAVPPDITIAAAEDRIEAAARELSLVSRMKQALGKYPGSIHWHYGRASLAGTVEVTLWPAHRRCWISVRENRIAAWVPDAVARLQRCMDRAAGNETATGGITDPEVAPCAR